jgi:hypothetical protein
MVVHGGEQGAKAEGVTVEDVSHGRSFLVPCGAERGGAWTQPVKNRHPTTAAPAPYKVN